MARAKLICVLFVVFFLHSTVHAHELTAYENFLVTYLTPRNIILVLCTLIGVASATCLFKELIARLLFFSKVFWESVMYSIGTVSLCAGFFVSDESSWIFGLSGALLLTGAFELSDQLMRWYINRIRFYAFCFIVWALTTVLYQHAFFGLVAGGHLFMVITICIADFFDFKSKGLSYGEKSMQEQLIADRNKRVRRQNSWIYLFRDTISALCVLVIALFLDIGRTAVPILHVLTLGFIIVAGSELVFDLLYVSYKEMHLEKNDSGITLYESNAEKSEPPLRLSRYWYTQVIVLSIASLLLMFGYLFSKPEFALIAYSFFVLFLPVKLYDLLESKIWKNIIVLCGCLLVSTSLFIFKDPISLITLDKIYTILHL